VVLRSPTPILNYLNPSTRDGLRSAFLRFPPFDRLALEMSALLLPCAAFAGDNDYNELGVVTLLAASLVIILLARWVALLVVRHPTRNSTARLRWRVSALLVLTLWMLLIQGASCPHADYLRIGPWEFHWGVPCWNGQHFKPAVVWLLVDRHYHLRWAFPTPL
jgi:hypothetical protein